LQRDREKSVEWPEGKHKNKNEKYEIKIYPKLINRENENERS
jgi:hypothetical protein